MSFIQYKDKTFRPETYDVIHTANEICTEYEADGYDLTLRQLYYQFVARDLLPNTQRSYKRLGSIVNDARLNGLISWDHIVDRTRELRALQHYSSPAEILRVASRAYNVDRWEGQEQRVEVWIEKDALVGVAERVCQTWDVGLFSCRGYVSQSEMHVAALRLSAYEGEGLYTTILHLGDHDPSGIDMTRDIQDRLAMFGAFTYVKRIALTQQQIRRFNPPPNPTKLTDSRSADYVERFGYSSWELDALAPPVLAGLITDEVKAVIDNVDEWESRAAEQKAGRAVIAEAADKHGAED